MESNSLIPTITDGLVRRSMMAINSCNKFAFLQCLLSLSLLPGIALAQAEQSRPVAGRVGDQLQVADALAKVKSGHFNGYHVGVIGDARAVEAIPDLEIQFGRASDPLDKAKIAQVLLALGDKKDEYWNFLAELAKPALESDSPNPIQYDSEGKSTPGLSADFVTWAQAHGQSPDDAGENAVFLYPGIVMLVGGTQDPRAVPLLRRALSSPNYLIEAAAAKGLAEIRDASSIPLMISRCKFAPAEAASTIAESLVYFDDPQAQSAVDTFVPREEARALREARASGRGALHR